MTESRYARYKKAFAGVPKPFAFLDLDLLRENIKNIRDRSRGKNVRIASKSIRSVPVLRLILESGEPFRGVMCYSPLEALFLAEQGFDDLLVAYPAWEKEHLRAVAARVKAGKEITLMVDSPPHVDRLEQVGREQEVCLPVCLDLDVSVSLPGLHFGVHRSPLSTRDSFLETAKKIRDAKHLRLDGIMGYEAQVAGVGDRVPGQVIKNGLIRLLKKHSISRTARIRKEWTAALGELGLSPRFINGGGTGSLAETAREDVVTEVTVGSGFYSPVLFDHYRSFRYQPAAGFALEVTRHPRPGIYTCAGGGYIASGAAGADRLPRPYLPAGARLTTLEGAGEVQTPLRLEEGELSLGDPIFFRHAKAGELCEHFNELWVISDGKPIDRYPTYRGMGACFL
ncbi:amino acid deaminase/aldolase [Kroppenstedtia eburnea]|uniref:amino acid deaminase/aldolase n=1 Tax=Kroppenstedtia eburnea TaxID=714067 RepID=UPI00363A7553